MQICGERSIFGEELGTPGAMSGGDTKNGQKPVVPPPANKGGVDAKKVDVTGPKRRYSIRMLSASEVIFIPKQLLEDFFTGASRKRQETKKELFEKLDVLFSTRSSWISDAVVSPSPSSPFVLCNCDQMQARN